MTTVDYYVRAKAPTRTKAQPLKSRPQYLNWPFIVLFSLNTAAWAAIALIVF